MNAVTGDEPLIRLVGIRKRFGSLLVLDGVDLAVRPGETVVVIGESGTGKSVLLKHIVRLLTPDEGAVYYAGRRVDVLSDFELSPILENFGFLFQLNALFDSLTVGENVAFPLVEQKRMRRRDAEQTALQCLTMVGLGDPAFLHKWPAELSGGQKKRVALARAIAMDPRVVLYDEPTTGLDPPRSDVINELILKLRRELGVAGVVVTHDMHTARKVADRIVMLHGGRFIFEGTPEEIDACPDTRVRDFVIGKAHDEDLRALREKRVRT